MKTDDATLNRFPLAPIDAINELIYPPSAEYGQHDCYSHGRTTAALLFTTRHDIDASPLHDPPTPPLPHDTILPWI